MGDGHERDSVHVGERSGSTGLRTSEGRDERAEEPARRHLVAEVDDVARGEEVRDGRAAEHVDHRLGRLPADVWLDERDEEGRRHADDARHAFGRQLVQDVPGSAASISARCSSSRSRGSP